MLGTVDGSGVAHERGSSRHAPARRQTYISQLRCEMQPFIIDIAASIMIIIMHYELMPLFVQVLSNFDLKPLVRRIYFHKNVIKLPPLFEFCVDDIFILF